MPDRSSIEIEGVGEMVLTHPPGTFALTPASHAAIQAVLTHRALISGSGIDWGSGVGALAITAALAAPVERVYGLELSAANVAVARENAARNGVAARTRFFHADSYRPFDPIEQAELEILRGRVDFVLANPPSSEGDDGFGFRREVMRGAARWLRGGGRLFLSISRQYGEARIAGLTEEVPAFRHLGPLYSTPWVPFELERPDLRAVIEAYAREEARGGLPYAFGTPGAPEQPLDARAALAHFRRSGESPLSQWQVHLFENGE